MFDLRCFQFSSQFLGSCFLILLMTVWLSLSTTSSSSGSVSRMSLTVWSQISWQTFLILFSKILTDPLWNLSCFFKEASLSYWFSAGLEIWLIRSSFSDSLSSTTSSFWTSFSSWERYWSLHVFSEFSPWESSSWEFLSWQSIW